MRYECVRDDIPKKWTELELLPGIGDDWILIQSNGIVDPSKTEMIMNQPTPEFRGTFDEANLELEKRIKQLEAFGYSKVPNKTDDDELLQP
jgi:hypothetical protein